MNETINSWQEWFQKAGEIEPVLEEYENLVKDYHELYEDGKTPNEKKANVNRAFAQRHTSDFWEDDSKIPSGVILNSIKFGLIGLGAGFVLSLVLSFVLGMFMPNTFITSLFAGDNPDISAKIIPGIIWGIIVAVVAVAIQIVPFILKRNKIIKQLTDLGYELEDYLSFIPPKYRNSFCVDAIYEMHTSYGVNDFQSCILTLDNHIKANSRVYQPFQAMVDVKYSGGNMASMPEKTYKPGEHDKSNPALPQDIDSHVSEGVEDADEALDELIGMSDVKHQIARLKNRMSFYDNDVKDSLSGNNMVFMGNPGSGKTITARIVAKLLFDFGYIDENRVIEVDGTYLKSPRIGETGERVNAILDYGLGGVVFIDEAYLLFSGNDGASTEATGVLLKYMEDHRGEIVIILAGYEHDMSELIASNEGFASRVRHKIRFSDYDADELMQIFKLFMSKLSGNWTIEKSAEDLLLQQFEQERKVPNFGNGRMTRNALDSLLDIHSDLSMNRVNGKGTQTTITEADVIEYVNMRKRSLAEDSNMLISQLHLDESIISMGELKSHLFEGSKNVEKDLKHIVGLNNVKDELALWQAETQFFEEDELTSPNILFVGNPGTGKSALAPIITGVLYNQGRIADNKYISVSGGFLRGSYVGHTAKRVEALVAYANNRVLFIDEAYALTDGNGQDAFGMEAIATLIAKMEENPQLTVIFAGYPDKMEHFLASNPGIKSRIGTIFEFKDYTPKELCQIFQIMAYKRGFKVDQGLYQMFANTVAPLIGGYDFGNARYVQQILDKTIRRHIMRFSQGEIDKENKMVLFAEDLDFS